MIFKILKSQILLLTGIILTALPALANGQAFQPVQNDTVIQLIVIGPGSDVYELEGHAAIRFSTPGYDYSVNYGTIDFDSPNFIYRFVKGQTDYSASACPTLYMFNSYIAEGRDITAFTLNLDNGTKKRMIELADSTLRPENRVYRYNYVLDNCATRPVKLIEEAAGGEIIFPDTEGETAGGQSFRSMMKTYHADYPWYQFGIDLALGSGIDSPIEVKDKTFAPVALAQMMHNATIDGKPLVNDSMIIYRNTEKLSSPTPWYLTPCFVMWCLFLLTLFICLRDIRKKRVSRWFSSLFYLVIGLSGLVLTFLIFVSVHYATSPNWLYVFINPLALIAGVAIWLKKFKSVVYWYQIANFASILLFLLFWWLLPQKFNAAVFPVALSDALLAATYIYVYNASKEKK